MTDEQWEQKTQKRRKLFRKCEKIRYALLLPIILMVVGIFKGSVFWLNLSVLILFLVAGTFLLLLVNMGMITRQMLWVYLYLYTNLLLSFIHQFVAQPIRVVIVVCQCILITGAGIMVLRKIKKLEDNQEDSDHGSDTDGESEEK